MRTQNLLWTPRAKQRPRTMYVKGQYRTFTPHETRRAETALREQWVGEPSEGPLAVSFGLWDDHIEVVMQSCPEPESRKLGRGDLDNYVKLIMDALNGRAWVDDRQIVAMSARKF